MPSNLAAELAGFIQTAKITGGPKCRTCSLPKALRELVEAERSKNGTSVNVLAKFLRSKGFPIPDTTLRRHFHQHAQ